MIGKGYHGIELVARHWLTRDILELQFTRPPDFDFLPGQFLRVLMDGYQRDYTLINAVESRTLDICIALVKGGRFTRVVTSLSVGDRLAVSGPHGHFIFQSGGHFPVFVATGTGVAPFVAFSRSGVSDGLLLHGAGSLDRLIYADRLCNSIGNYVPCVRRLPEDGHQVAKGRLVYVAVDAKGSSRPVDQPAPAND